MRLLNKLKFWRKKPIDEFAGLADIVDDSTSVEEYDSLLPGDASKVINGGIRRAKHKQFILDEHRHGGRIVKTMPRNLRHMKELSEKTDD